MLVLLAGVVSIIGFSGYRVMSRNKNVLPQSSSLPSQQIVIDTSTVGTDSNEVSQEKLEIQSPGSAANQVKPNQAGNTNTNTTTTGHSSGVPQGQGTIIVSDQYSVATPIGSLSQLFFEAKRGQYSNALYFVTPDFLSRAYRAVNVQDFSQFVSNCETNDACKMIAATKFNLDVSHITEESCSTPNSSVFKECRKIGTKFKYEDNTLRTVYYKTVGYDIHSAYVTMLKSNESTNWVIDSVTVDDFTL